MTNNQFSVNGRQCYNRYIKNQLQICTIIATGEKIPEALFDSNLLKEKLHLVTILCIHMKIHIVFFTDKSNIYQED